MNRTKAKSKTTTVVKKKSKPKPPAAPALQQLSPHQIVRYRDAEPYFGYRHAQFDELIRTGKIPRPMPLSEGGKASGWTGQMILDHHEHLKRLALKKPTPETS